MTGGTGGRVGRLEALSPDHQHHTLAPRALELEHRTQHAREELAAVAAQIAVQGLGQS